MAKQILTWACASVLAYVVLVAAALSVSTLVNHPASTGSRSGIYAVFLSNGQVYFGNISQEDTAKLTLTGVYYIQNNSDTQNADNQSNVALEKLGNELHGPQDFMEINQSSVLFVEALRSDSKITKAIQDYKQP